MLEGVNDIAYTHPDIAEQWHPTKNGDLKPTQVTYGTSNKIWWLCQTCETTVRFSKPADVSDECKTCKQQRKLNLEGSHPDLAEQWHPTKNGDLEPTQVTYGTSRKVWWLGECGHEWDASVKNRTINGQGCPVCAGVRVEQGYNDVASVAPHLIPEWHPIKNGGLSIEDFTKGTDTVAWWLGECGHEWKARINDRVRGGSCHRCNSSSRGEDKLREALEEIVGHELPARNKVNGVEVDIFIEDFNLAVEFNGLYWHSEATGHGRYYHSVKTEACLAVGVDLIHVWEDDWRDKRQVVLTSIASKMGILDKAYPVIYPGEKLDIVGARKLKAGFVSKDKAYAFLNKHHIQGSASGSIYAGLFNADGSLCAVLVGKRSSSKNVWNIERYATSGVVQGGFSKLLKFASEEVLKIDADADTWVTFSDNSSSKGELYRNCGFIKTADIKPDYRYVYKNLRVHKFNFRKKNFKSDPNLKYVDDMSEKDLASLNKIYRIWDAGKVRWEKPI